MHTAHLSTHVSGYACYATTAELDAALAAFRSGGLSAHDLHLAGQRVRLRRWQAQRDAGLDYVAVNDFTLADPLLDLACTFGQMPERFGPPGAPVTLQRYLRMAHGRSREDEPAIAPLERAAFAGTDEVRCVPEFDPARPFHLAWTKIIDETREAAAAGFRPKPVLTGPLSLLYHGGCRDGELPRLLDELLPVYRDLLQALHAAGAEWVEIREPAMETCALLPRLAAAWQRPGLPSLLLALPAQADLALAAGFDGVHVDLTDEPRQELQDFPAGRVLSLGVIAGDHPARTDLLTLRRRLSRLRRTRAAGMLWLGADGPLHEISVEPEAPRQRHWFSNSHEKLHELAALAAVETPMDACAAASRALRKRQRALADFT